MEIDVNEIEVIAPNFKRRLSGVTATIARLVPLQAREIGICTCAPDMLDDIPNLPWQHLLTMSRRGPSGHRIWHARRNIEMIAGLALKWCLGKKLRLVFTSASQRDHTWLTRWLIARMDAVIATSAKSAAYLQRPAHIIHHGIDCDQFFPTEGKSLLRSELGLPDTGPLIGCFGRIRHQKGTDVFVDAMIEICARHQETTAVVMGRATDEHAAFLNALKAKVKAAGLEQHILFLPEVPVWEVAKFYQALDLYVAPQRWEGFGLTPLEAMACGVGVVATDVGAFDELIDDGQTGQIVEPGSKQEMIDAIDALLDDPHQLNLWGDAARMHVLEHFQLDDEARALLDVYRTLLGR